MKLFAFGPKTECYLARVWTERLPAAEPWRCMTALRDCLVPTHFAGAARRRGVQTALLQRRLARASQAERRSRREHRAAWKHFSPLILCGRDFEVLYTRVKFRKALAA